MSQTHGDLSGARPTQDYSACDHSLTHITLGCGVSDHQYPSQQPTTQQTHHTQQTQQTHHFQPAQQQQQQQLTHQTAQQYQEQQEQQALQEFLDESAPDVVGDLPVLHPGVGGTAGGGSGGGGAAAAAVGGGGVFAARAGLGCPPYIEAPLGGPAGGGRAAAHNSAAAAAAASPQDFLFPPQVYDNTMMLKEQADYGANLGDDPDDREGEGLDDGADGNSQGSGKRSRTRRPHLQGRFSGRLTTKEDERRLAEECKLLGPLLGGVGKRGDKSRLTLAKIVRGIATGDVRRFCEERERAIAMLKAKLAAIDPEAAASVPVNPISLPSSQLGPLGSLAGMNLGLGPLGSGLGPQLGGQLGGPLGGLGAGVGVGGAAGGSLATQTQAAAAAAAQLAAHSAQIEALQRENGELQHEVFSLRTELQARERLLLELQDTGIISGFVPTSIPMDDVHRTMSQQTGHMSGAAGTRTHSTDMAPHPQYGLQPRHHSYGQQQQHGASYGGPSQMSVPQSSAQISGGMEPGPMQPKPLGPQLGPAAGGGGGSVAVAGGGTGQQISIQPGAGAAGPLGVDGTHAMPLPSAMPAMSEHSRAGGRPLKRQHAGELLAAAGGPGGGPGAGGGGPGGPGGYGEVPRTLSHPPLGRGGPGFPHMDLQQQLNSLQAQVEHLQNLQGSGRGPPNFLMPMRERALQPMRVAGGGGQMQYGGSGGGGGGTMPSPFLSGHGGGQGGGLLMLPGHQADSAGNPYSQPHAHGGMNAPLQLQQMIKQQPPSLYDDVGGRGVGPIGRDPRDVATVGPGGALPTHMAPGGGRHAGMGGAGGGAAAAGASGAGGPSPGGPGAGPDGYAGGGPGGLDATLEHIINSRAMRGEYDLPLELLLGGEGGGKGLGSAPAPGPGPH